MNISIDLIIINKNLWVIRRIWL